MFRVSRWADAFLAVSGKDADEAVVCLKALVPPLKSAHGILFGHDAAAKLEAALREKASGNMAEEYAIRFICLLTAKKYLKYIDLLINSIEKKLDTQKGVLCVTLQTASPQDSNFEKELAQSIKERTGAASVKMETQINPELLGGYSLRIGDFYIDASLKGQLEKMTAQLIGDGGNDG